MLVLLLEQIFDKNMLFLKNDFFWMCDKSAGSADINEKMLEKDVDNLFRTESNALAISITPFSRKVNFRHHTPKNGHFRKWFI